MISYSISGLPSLTSNREAIDLSNPIWSGVKERVCCILHDLGDTWLDYVVIEGPYVTEEVSEMGVFVGIHIW